MKKSTLFFCPAHFIVPLGLFLKGPSLKRCGYLILILKGSPKMKRKIPLSKRENFSLHLERNKKIYESSNSCENSLPKITK
jgi:hypothetical protein